MDFTKVSDSELINEMNKRFIIPNFYLQEHFDKMENWDEEKVKRFKEFMCWSMGNDSTLTELMDALIGAFEEEENEDEEEVDCSK